MTRLHLVPDITDSHRVYVEHLGVKDIGSIVVAKYAHGVVVGKLDHTPERSMIDPSRAIIRLNLDRGNTYTFNAAWTDRIRLYPQGVNITIKETSHETHA